MKASALTREQLIALPASIDLRTLGQAFGISEPVVRDLHRRGHFQDMGIRINRLGAQYRVVTADVLRALGIELVSPVPEGGPVMSAVRGGA